jgi:hypothetical protein
MNLLKWLFRHLTGQAFTLYVDSGGGGSSGPSTSTTQTSNIPEYAKPYVETMLGATQKQLFNTTTDNGVTTIDSMKGYTPFSTNMNDYFAGASPMQQQAYRGAANLGVSKQNTDASNMSAMAGTRALGTKYGGDEFGNAYQGLESYDPGQYNQQSIQAPDLQNYQMDPAQQVAAQNFGGQSAQDYMSPYMQNVVDIQQREAQRQADIAGTQRGASAAKSGAFGGSRQAVMDAEAARNLATQKGDIQAQGLQAAYQQAQTQFNADQARQMAAQQSNQNAGLTVGQQNLNANLGVQSLGAGQNMQGQLANQQTNLATQQAQQAANQYGYGQDVLNAQNLAQYQQAANALNANQQQFGANLGMQGINAANTAAQNLGQLGQNQYNQQTGAINLQNQLGTQQQQLEQNKINQQIQNYANEQQWGMQQLSNMNSMLRGLPMQNTSTQSYQAAPSAVSQLAGLGAIGAGVATRAAKGGSTKDIEKRKPSAGLAAGALNKVMKG